MSSYFRRLQKRIDELVVDLVRTTLPDTVEENINTAVEFCRNNITYHQFQDARKPDVQQEVSGLIERYHVHNQGARAQRLADLFYAFEKLCPTNATSEDTHYSIMKLLVELAQHQNWADAVTMETEDSDYIASPAYKRYSLSPARMTPEYSPSRRVLAHREHLRELQLRRGQGNLLAKNGSIGMLPPEILNDLPRDFLKMQLKWEKDFHDSCLQEDDVEEEDDSDTSQPDHATDGAAVTTATPSGTDSSSAEEDDDDDNEPQTFLDILVRELDYMDLQSRQEEQKAQEQRRQAEQEKLELQRQQKERRENVPKWTMLSQLLDAQRTQATAASGGGLTGPLAGVDNQPEVQHVVVAEKEVVFQILLILSGQQPHSSHAADSQQHRSVAVFEVVETYAPPVSASNMARGGYHNDWNPFTDAGLQFQLVPQVRVGHLSDFSFQRLVRPFVRLANQKFAIETFLAAVDGAAQRAHTQANEKHNHAFPLANRCVQALASCIHTLCYRWEAAVHSFEQQSLVRLPDNSSGHHSGVSRPHSHEFAQRPTLIGLAAALELMASEVDCVFSVLRRVAALADDVMQETYGSEFGSRQSIALQDVAFADSYEDSDETARISSRSLLYAMGAPSHRLLTLLYSCVHLGTLSPVVVFEWPSAQKTDTAGMRQAALYAQLFFTALEPYVDMLNAWCVNGVVDDPFHEFMVQERSLPSRYSRTTSEWSRRFRLRRHVISPWLPRLSGSGSRSLKQSSDDSDANATVVRRAGSDDTMAASTLLAGRTGSDDSTLIASTILDRTLVRPTSDDSTLVAGAFPASSTGGGSTLLAPTNVASQYSRTLVAGADAATVAAGSGNDTEESSSDESDGADTLAPLAPLDEDEDAELCVPCFLMPIAKEILLTGKSYRVIDAIHRSHVRKKQTQAKASAGTGQESTLDLGADDFKSNPVSTADSSVGADEVRTVDPALVPRPSTSAAPAARPGLHAQQMDAAAFFKHEVFLRVHPLSSLLPTEAAARAMTNLSPPRAGVLVNQFLFLLQQLGRHHSGLLNSTLEYLFDRRQHQDQELGRVSAVGGNAKDQTTDHGFQAVPPPADTAEESLATLLDLHTAWPLPDEVPMLPSADTMQRMSFIHAPSLASLTLDSSMLDSVAERRDSTTSLQLEQRFMDTFVAGPSYAGASTVLSTRDALRSMDAKRQPHDEDMSELAQSVVLDMTTPPVDFSAGHGKRDADGRAIVVPVATSATKSDLTKLLPDSALAAQSPGAGAVVQGSGQGHAKDLDHYCPAPILLQQCLLNPLLARFQRVSVHLSHFVVGNCGLLQNFAALREFFLMANGELILHFTESLFSKLDSWRGRIFSITDGVSSDEHELNSLLRDCWRVSDVCNEYLTSRVSVKIAEDPSAPSQENTVKLLDPRTRFLPSPKAHGYDDSVSMAPVRQKVHADRKWLRKQRKRRRMQAFSEFCSKAPLTVTVLKYLRFKFEPPWPLNLIVTPESMERYNRIFVYLLQIRRAKFALEEINKDTWHQLHLVQRIHHRRRRGKVVGNASRAPTRGGLSSSIEHTTASAIRDVADEDKLDWFQGAKPLFFKLQTMHRERLHFVDALNDFALMRTVHSEWPALLEKIRECQETGIGGSLDELREYHDAYLQRISHQLLLDQRVSNNAFDKLVKMLDLSVKLKLIYQRHVLPFLDVKQHRVSSRERKRQLRVIEKLLDDNQALFRSNMRFVMVVLTHFAKEGFYSRPHLDDLICRLNFNGFYEQD